MYAQYTTHNAQTLSAIYYMAGQNYYPGQYEFQCLHGMGEPLYELVTVPVQQDKLNRTCRTYATVSPDETFLAYMELRVPENGANTPFVNKMGAKENSIDTLKPHPVANTQHNQPLREPTQR